MPIRDKIADGFAAVDELAEDLGSTFYNRWKQLVFNTDERMPFIWTDAGADISATPNSIGAMSTGMREVEWSKAAELLFAAAYMQTYFEYASLRVYEKSRKYSAREKEAGKQMSKDELVKAAVEGTKKERFEAAKARRMSRSATV